MNERPLRPLTLGEMIDTGFKVYLRNWRALLSLVAVVVVPAGVLQYFLLVDAIPQDVYDRLSDPTLVIDDATLDAVRRLLAVTAATLLIQALASMLATAGVMRVVAEAYLGRSPDWRASLRFAAQRLPALLATVLLMVAGVAALAGGAWLIAGVDVAGPLPGGFVALVLPALMIVAVWIGITWAVAVPALVVERIGPVQALARSYTLVRGRWWAVFGTLLTVGLIVVIVGEVAARILGAFVSGAGEAVVSIGIAAITTPFLVSVLAVLYFDLRARKEHFTLARLAADVGAPPPEPEGTFDASGDDWQPLPPTGETG